MRPLNHMPNRAPLILDKNFELLTQQNNQINYNFSNIYYIKNFSWNPVNKKIDFFLNNSRFLNEI